MPASRASQTSSVIQTNFTAGELSPRLLGRTDIDKYKNGAATIKNFTVLKHGGVTRRMGTKFVKSTKGNGKVRLVPFQYSSTQTYMLEFGVGYIRVYRDSGELLEEDEQIEITATEEGVFGGIYTESELSELNFAQSADVLFVTHPNHIPFELRRLSGGDDLVANWEWVKYRPTDGPWLDLNADADHTLEVSGLSGAVTVTSNREMFSSTDFLRLIAIDQASTTEDSEDESYGKVLRGHGQIVGIDDSRHATVLTTVNFQEAGVDGASSLWRLGAWGEATGFPRAITFHQNRLWFGGNIKQPQTIWASVTNDFNSFAPNNPEDVAVVRDTDGLNFTIADNRVNTIQNMKSEVRGLLVLTDGGEFVGMADGLFKPITPTNFAIARHGNFGSPVGVQALQVADRVLFIQSAGRRIRELGYSFESDRYQGLDLTLLSDHLTESRLNNLSYQQERESVIWATNNDGSLLGLTYERPEKVYAWHQHILGGSYLGGQAVVESIAAIREENEDQLWLVVRRHINGGVVRYVEILKEPFRPTDNVEDAFFVDSGLSQDNRVNIAAATQTSPVQVTTESAHGFATTDSILIRHCTGMAEINDNIYYPMNPSGDTFDLGKTKPMNITAISKANPAVVTAPGHGIATDDKVFLNVDSGMTELDNKTVTATRISTDTFSIGVDTSITAAESYTVFDTAATATISVDTTGAPPPGVQYVGEGDTIVLISGESPAITVTLTLRGTAGETTSEATSGTAIYAKTFSSGGFATSTLHAIAQAAEIKTAINFHTSFSATVDGAKVTVTQATEGVLGNTEITITEIGAAGLSKTDFTGGANGVGTAQALEVGTSFGAYTGNGKAGKKVTAVSGLTHLVGETVAVCGDGADLGTYTVASGGTLTLARSASVVHVGLPYTSEIKTLPLIYASRMGDSRGMKARAFKMLLRLYRSMGGKAGLGDRIDGIDYRVPSDDMGMPPTLFTGMKDVGVTISNERDAQVTIQHSGPQPMTILAIHSEMDVGGI